MNRKPLTIAAVATTLLVAGCIAATSHIGRKTEENYNGWLDRVLAELPFLKVEKRSYERGLFGAEPNLVLRFDVPDLPKPDEGEDEDGDEAGEEADAVSAAGGGRIAAAAEAASALPRAVVMTVHDRIRHGPFPGSLMPAAARIATSVDIRMERANGSTSAPWTVLTADSSLDFSGGYQARYLSPAGEWQADEARIAVAWAGMEGQSQGRLADNASRYAAKSPGLTMRGVDRAGQPFEFVIGRMAVQGHTDPSPSPLTAAGEMKSTVASLKISVRPEQARPSILALDDISADFRSTRNGELLELRNVVQGKGRFNDARIDGFEMVEHYQRIHAPTFERLIRNFHAGWGKPEVAAAPAQFHASLLEDLRALVTYDPSYALEKLTLEIDGEKAEIAYHLALQGASPGMFDNPMLLAGAASAGLKASMPRAWLEAFAAGEGMGGVVEAGQMGGLIEQGVRRGLLAVDGQTVSTEVRFEKGELEVNGNTLFRLPPQR